ncbi:Mitochondrial intermediate peptidase [Holothuria leucospilota]|uniref:Mitochondrial intermediate peptidase n=1 Tax=Holothuria leucospilota TaxID=206669 RepID=A0A9Q1H3B8_HOLLE|nr:Mitochondrial intermediate peptidase [Holothuria leucospilota]
MAAYLSTHQKSLLRVLLKQSRTSTCLKRNKVATWSPLAAVFNAKSKQKLKTSQQNVGLFEMPELTSPTGFAEAEKKSLKEADELVEAAVNAPPSQEVVVIFDKLSDALCRIADLADFIRVAHPDKRFTSAAEQTCMNVSAAVEKLNTNVGLHQSLKRLLDDKSAFNAMDEESQRVAELFMFDFEQSGIHLPEAERKEFVQLNAEAMVLGSQFVHGSHMPVSVDKSLLPDHLRYSFSVDGNQAKINSLHAENPDDLVREAAYKIYLYPNQDQSDLLDKLLKCRHKIANIAGFPTYAERALRGTMAKNSKTVSQFLEKASKKLLPSVTEELEMLKEAKARHNPSSKSLKAWDSHFLIQHVRNEKFKINNSEFMPYFSLGACMDGLNIIFQNLYGISLESVEAENGEVWAPDVQKLEVRHKEDGILGYIFCDFCDRAGKPQQDCHFTIRGGRLLDDGTYQLPKVVLTCCFDPPTSSTPTLLTHGMMENLFHEFGHAMHSMLARTKYQHVTGTRCATDFAEVPSILMEYFANDYRVLRQFARHYQSKETLPEEMISKLCDSKKMFAAHSLQTQICYSMFDQVLHGNHPLTETTTKIYEHIQNKYSSIPYVPNTAWHLRFGHLVGYGAKYYSYLYSRAVAHRIWTQCFFKDPLNREMGERYKETMLAHGGGKEPSLLVENMLGKQLTTDDLVDSLVNEVSNS